MIFKDRYEAGKKLAEALSNYFGRPDMVFLALPRGGIPVGFELSKALHVPLDVFLVRKLGVPGHEESARLSVAAGVPTGRVDQRYEFPALIGRTPFLEYSRKLCEGHYDDWRMIKPS
jgi:predicted phosphoribosyltransferase